MIPGTQERTPPGSSPKIRNSHIILIVLVKDAEMSVKHEDLSQDPDSVPAKVRLLAVRRVLVRPDVSDTEI